MNQTKIINLVRSRMDEVNITPYGIEKMTGVSRSTISRWMHGKQNITLEVFLKITKALNIEIKLKKVAK